jgi:hypothetical protein
VGGIVRYGPVIVAELGDWRLEGTPALGGTVIAQVTRIVDEFYLTWRPLDCQLKLGRLDWRAPVVELDHPLGGGVTLTIGPRLRSGPDEPCP